MILPDDEQKLPKKDTGLVPYEVTLDLDQQQLALFSDREGNCGVELLTIDDDERAGKYSGKIIDKNKAKLRAIVQALASGVGQLKVAKAFSVSVHTVRGIVKRHPELIAIEEKKLSEDIGFAVKLGVERYIEAIINGEIPAAQLPVGLGILFDKKQLLDGKPTSISTAKPALDLETMKKVLSELPSLGPGGEVIEIEGKSETQSGGQDA
jgi:hypothetical protein